MRKILLVKTSSLGDVVHNLPVVSDIGRAFAGAIVDWVVEKPFATIPRCHPGVRRVIGCELRKWRRSPLARATRSECRAFLRELRAERYDAIVDTQGLLKSALIARAARGWRAGLDWRSSREPLRPFYDRVYRIPWSLHAVERNRRLAAAALGYEASAAPHYGIEVERARAEWLPAGPYAVLLHATSDRRKLWPEPSWIELGTRLAQAGVVAVLPSGSAAEREAASRLAASIGAAARAAPALGIAELAGVIAGARLVAGVDTGLTHLAAALGIPVVGIFGATDPRATGVRSAGHAVNLGGLGRFPATGEVVDALQEFGVLA